MSAYIGDVVKNGLVLYLDAANSKSYVSGSSTWFDLSGNNNSGSLTNGPTFSSDVKGNMVFDGTNDHVILARPSIMSGSQVSFCVWVNITQTRDGSIIWLEDGNDARYFSVHLTWGDNVIYFDGGNGTGTSGGVFDRINKSTTATERSGWHYWCFTKNSSTGIMRIYLDGTLWHSGTGQNAPVAAASLGLINKTDGASYVAHHRNAISSIKFYNRELSAAEILENYNATKGRFDTPRAINSVQPRLVTNGLVMCLDAGNRESYVSGSNIIYDLVPTRSISICGTVGENGTLTLTAPSNYVFTSVDFASYGTPTGSCGSFTTSSCHSATSYTYVASQLLGKTGSVSIGATNANFGDPCGGTVKRLYVQATATGPSVTGSLINGPTFNSSNNGSIVFDGSNDYIQILDNSLQISTGVTVTSIVKPNVIGENKSRLIDTANVSANTGIVSGSTIALKIGTINPYQDISWFISDGISNSYEIRRSNSVITSTSVPYIITARWRKSDGNASIFVNGVETSYTTSATFTGTPGTLTNPMMIGFLRGFNLYGNQTIYATHLYNRYLSNEEILQNYNALKGRFGL